MKHGWVTLSLGVGALVASATLTETARAAASPPSGAHPRVWLGGQTLATIKANAGKSGTAASGIAAACAKITSKESELVQAGIQGYNWAYSLGTCALAWQITRDPAHAVTAVRLYRALLDDYVTMGDGAGGDGVVQHDTGYAMRFFGAYAAIAYDWLADAPGVDATLQAHARARFQAWTQWYDTAGYLNHTPGSNYHAGYVFAKTIMAVAAAGEDGATSDAYWSDVTTNLFPKDLVQGGLGAGGPLAGGDWPEGWQYGPPSIMEYALAARLLADNGVTFPEVKTWLDALVTRFVHGTIPTQDFMYTAGDLDDDANFDAPLNPRTLIATLAGPSDDAAAAKAQQLKSTIATAQDLCPAFDAIAEARGAAPADPRAGEPLVYLAPGARNLYARTSWDKDALFAVFTSAPKMIPDHQHADASGFILYRGADRLVVDSSPYGSRSSLTGNALTAVSDVVPDAYRPSQSPWARADLPWARATASGVVAARADIGDAFRSDTSASDVAFARRDWTFLPEGEVVAIDRVRTGDASRPAYLRFRTPGSMSMSGGVATATVGGSRLVVHPAKLSGGTPGVAHVAVDDCWSGSSYGQCAGARIAIDQYALTVPGPQGYAVHVLDALGASEAAADVSSLDGTDDGAVLGAVVDRGASRTVVLSSGDEAPSTASTMTYGAPGDRDARHVVFDAPEDEAGKSTVTASAQNGRCVVTATPGGASAFTGRPLVFHVAAASAGCAVTEDGAAPIGTGGGADGGASSGGAGDDAGAPSGGGGAGAGTDGGVQPAGGGALSPASGGAGTASGASDASGDGGSAGGCSAGAAPTAADARTGLAWLALLFFAGRMRRRGNTG